MMACDDFLNDVERLLNGTLEPEAEQNLRRHLGECASCAAVYETMLADDSLLQDFAAGHADSVQRIEQGVISSLEARNAVQATVVPLWRKMMSNVGIRIAAMFVVAFGVAIIFNLFAPNPDIDFNGWDRVSARVQSAPAIYFHGTIKDERGTTVDVQNWISKDYGYRMDIRQGGTVISTVYYDPKTKELITLMPTQRAYFVIPMHIEEVYNATDNMDMRQMVAEMLKLEHKELGTKRINGRLAAGIEVTDGAFEAGEFDKATGRLWVDVENEWPVRMEIEGTAAAGKINNKIVVDDFKWDQIDAGAFDVKVPAGYHLVFKTDPVFNDEEHAIEGLRSYADLTNRYPSVLNARTALFEYRSGDASPLGSGADIRAMRILSTSAFFRTISRDYEDVRYNGDVEPGDAAKVLLLWRVDEGTYRVIFGDLSTMNVDAAELEQLEQ